MTRSLPTRGDHTVDRCYCLTTCMKPPLSCLPAVRIPTPFFTSQPADNAWIKKNQFFLQWRIHWHSGLLCNHRPVQSALQLIGMLRYTDSLRPGPLPFALRTWKPDMTYGKPPEIPTEPTGTAAVECSSPDVVWLLYVPGYGRRTSSAAQPTACLHTRSTTSSPQSGTVSMT